MIRRLLLAAVCGTCLTTHALAALPVIDGVAQAQRIQQQLENVRQTLVQLDQYANMIKRLETQIKTYTVTLQQYEAMTGQYGLGDLRRLELEQQWQTYFPGSYTGPTADLADRLALLPAIEQLHERLGEWTMAMMEEMRERDPLGMATYQRADTAIAVDAIAQGSYEGAVERLQNYQTMMVQIEQTDDLKSAADLQNRIQIEHGMALNNIAQLQASANQLAAKLEHERIVMMAEDEKVNTYQPAPIDAIPVDPPVPPGTPTGLPPLPSFPRQ